MASADSNTSMTHESKTAPFSRGGLLYADQFLKILQAGAFQELRITRYVGALLCSLILRQISVHGGLHVVCSYIDESIELVLPQMRAARLVYVAFGIKDNDGFGKIQSAVIGFISPYRVRVFNVRPERHAAEKPIDQKCSAGMRPVFLAFNLFATGVIRVKLSGQEN